MEKFNIEHRNISPWQQILSMEFHSFQLKWKKKKHWIDNAFLKHKLTISIIIEMERNDHWSLIIYHLDEKKYIMNSLNAKLFPGKEGTYLQFSPNAVALNTFMS